MKTFRIILAVVLTLLIAVLGIGLYAAVHVSSLTVNYPGLTLKGIDVGGLTKEQTVETLTAHNWEEQKSVPLTVTTLGEQSFTVDPEQSGVLLSAKEAAELAWSYGRDRDMFSNLLTWLDCRRHSNVVQIGDGVINTDYLVSLILENREDIAAWRGNTEYTPDFEAGLLELKKGGTRIQLDDNGLYYAILDALRACETELRYTTLMTTDFERPDFQSIYNTLHQEPRDASFTDDGRFDVIDEIVGCDFDVNLANQLWDAAAPAEEISVPMSVTWPSVTAQQLRGSLFHDLLGACTTSYWNSTENRCSNVQLASSKINDTVLYPGDVFSYNTVVGERTREAGFLPAPAYVDGDVKDEIGGGACQVSSTLYAATVFAFMETVERENHYFPVHYMQLGTDATVTIPEEGGRAIDFKFRNNRNYPIRIVAYCDTETRELTFEIWGTLEDEDLMPVEFDNTWGWEMVYDRVIEPADPNRPGYKIKLTHERYYFNDDIGEGARTLTHREVYDSEGNMVRDDLLNPLLPNGGPAMDTYYDHN